MMEQLRKRLSLNKQKPTQMSGFFFGGLLGFKFEPFLNLFSIIIYKKNTYF